MSDRREKHLEREVADLQLQLKALQTDSVTGIPVRRVFERELAGRIRAGHARDSDRFGILMIDIDHFKRFNDEFGHVHGDMELNRVAHIIRKHLRPSDILARYGGEEFVVLVPRANRKTMVRLAERVRAGVYLGEGFTTISVGHSHLLPDDKSEWAVVERADAALYQAKNAGRNRVKGAY